ncbi:transglutaminase N-terminal domain-containing protein [Caenispirillum salinarum]|uniref:transglutaminase family protein n=1 Tax=Caenispirillum salinarum TaxID=859058 RepID=UPI0038507D88
MSGADDKKTPHDAPATAMPASATFDAATPDAATSDAARVAAAAAADPRAAVTYRVTHETRYDYSQPVTISHHLAHLRPRNLATQQVHRHKLTVTPRPSTMTERRDYFGNAACYFTLEETHEELRAVADSLVTVTPPRLPDPDGTPPWESVREMVRDTRRRDLLDACQYTFASPNVPLPAEVRDLAAESFPPGRPLLEAVLDLTTRIHADFSYDPTATTVATPLAEVLAERRGVCQDFAHLQIACLRALGLPARYVSGYVLSRSLDEIDRVLEGADASHAWVSVYLPDGGWIDVDPTNDKLPTREHVTVAWGRDFSDVSPLKGVMMGGGAHTVSVGVTVAPVPADAADGPAVPPAHQRRAERPEPTLQAEQQQQQRMGGADPLSP